MLVANTLSTAASQIMPRPPSRQAATMFRAPMANNAATNHHDAAVLYPQTANHTAAISKARTGHADQQLAGSGTAEPAINRLTPRVAIGKSHAAIQDPAKSVW